MNCPRLARIVFLLLFAAYVGQALYVYPRLPAEVACHFDAAGRPDAWCGKEQFLIFHLGTLACLAGTFLGVGLALRKLPAGFIHLPNKTYWLAPERRRQTLDYMQSCLLWLGSLTLLFFLDLARQTFQVHLGHANKLNHVWLSLGAYLAATATGSIVLFAKFRKKDSG